MKLVSARDRRSRGVGIRSVLAAFFGCELFCPELAEPFPCCCPGKNPDHRYEAGSWILRKGVSVANSVLG